jgi:hypothetical protein
LLQAKGNAQASLREACNTRTHLLNLSLDFSYALPLLAINIITVIVFAIIISLSSLRSPHTVTLGEE